jgi:hypothetical protein
MQLIGNQNSFRMKVRRTEHVRISTLQIKPICSVYELHTQLAISNGIRLYGTDFWIHSLVYSCMTSKARTKAQDLETVMDLVHCIQGNFLVIPTFVARCLYVCKDARDPSGKRWNYLSKSLIRNLAEMTVFSPFM